MKNRTDAEWIAGLVINDPQAVSDLWEMLFEDWVHIARMRGESEDGHPEGAVNAYVKIIRKGIHQYQLECPFPLYCRRILVRESLRLIKRMPGPVERNEDPAFPLEVDRLDPEKIQQHLQPCLDHLSIREQDIIDQCYKEGKTPGAIAGSWIIERNDVNLIALRARLKLRACLDKRGYRRAQDFESATPRPL
jgi:DNA-directed RNA polymerase specialized sigma24 family protein